MVRGQGTKFGDLVQIQPVPAVDLDGVLPDEVVLAETESGGGPANLVAGVGLDLQAFRSSVKDSRRFS